MGRKRGGWHLLYSKVTSLHLAKNSRGAETQMQTRTPTEGGRREEKPRRPREHFDAVKYVEKACRTGVATHPRGEVDYRRACAPWASGLARQTKVSTRKTQSTAKKKRKVRELREGRRFRKTHPDEEERRVPSTHAL